MMPSKPAAGAKPAGGGSAASLAEARRDLDKVLKADQALAAPLADELFALVDALDADAALPRALTNPNRAAGPKELLVRRAMAGHRPAAVALAARVATLRWSKEGDLADALEELAFAAALSAAATDSTRRALEAELFQVDAVLANNRDLRTALGDAAAKPAARAKLARAVFAPSLSP
ncbi:MAG: hypothetical protein LBE08_05540, partial [Bifidobacteriaceae bacterium]|nr:hypothetical protein [Bifidobacteriaceae bacterium]